MRRALDAVLGIGYFAFLVAFVAVAVLVYDKAFVDRTQVTLVTSVMGNALQKGSDVKLHGVPVGTVSNITPDGTGARLTLDLDPDVAGRLSTKTSALLLPKTLFGERYVALEPPTSATGTPAGLHDGDLIHQDASARAVELQQVFDKMMPVLQSLHPDKLAATIGALATMLRGQGTEIGDAMSSWADYLHKLNPLVPQMADDFAELGTVASQYADAMPDLLDALDTMTTTSRTLVKERTDLKQVFASVIDASDTSRGWMDANSGTIRILSSQSRRALDAVAPYATEFPCLFKAAKDFIPVMDKNLGKGTDEPGIHVVLNVEPSRGKYVAGRDRPTHVADAEARCPYETGKTGTTAAPAARRTTDQPATIPAPPSASVDQQLAQVSGGLGQANSPAENQLIAELMAPSAGVAPADYPQWGSLLLGPVLRGTEVILK
ncbi:MCE family protein [Nocardioides sp. DS6]|uniref:MCE family protein n=1 Tax=Nocardioides eburneus TaxID=3231482 RepID=A0ABV3STC9_9ACTN